jgi:hypothetical protein
MDVMDVISHLLLSISTKNHSPNTIIHDGAACRRQWMAANSQKLQKKTKIQSISFTLKPHAHLIHVEFDGCGSAILFNLQALHGSSA